MMIKVDTWDTRDPRQVPGLIIGLVLIPDTEISL